MRRSEVFEYPIYDALRLPVRGLASRPHPSVLGPGFWRQINGFRRDSGVLRVRHGSDRVTSAPVITGGVFYGVSEVRLNGTTYIAAAVKSGSAVRIMISSNGGSTWTEVTNDGATAADDKYGNTRMTDTGSHFYFCAVRDRALGRDLLVVQNGTDSPRVYDPLASDAAAPNSCKVAKHEEVIAPQVTGWCRVQWGFFDDWPIGGGTSGGGTMTYAASSANFTSVESGSGVERFLLMTASTSAADGDTVTISDATVLVTTPSKQLVMLFECNDRAIWQKIKVECREGVGAWNTLWEPTTTTLTMIEEPYDYVSNKSLVAFPIEHLNLASISQVRITWKSTSPSASTAMKIYGVWASGCIPGGSEFGLSFYNSGSRGESPGVILPNTYNARVGGPIAGQFGTWLGGSVIPQRSSIYYYPRIFFIQPSSTEIAKGVDTMRVYYREADTEGFFLSATGKVLATYAAGAWAGVTTSGAATSFTSFNPATPASMVSFIDEKTSLPYGLHRPIPSGTAMLMANRRLFVAGKTDNSTAFSVAWMSEWENPFRFLVIPQDGEFSATQVTFDGESIQSFVALASSSIGNNGILCVTDQNIFRFDGPNTIRYSQPTRLALIGSRSPMAIAAYKNDLYILDDRLRVQRLMSGFSDISGLSVDDVFQDIPAAQRSNVSFAFVYDRLYGALTPLTSPASTTNKNLAVFNPEIDSWESIDTLPGFTARYVMSAWYDTEKRRRLLVFADDCHVYEYEKPGETDDYGLTGVSTSLGSRSIHEGMNIQLSVHRFRIVSTSSAGSTLNVTRTYLPSGGTATSEIDLTPQGSEPQVSRYDGSQSVTGDARGNQIQIDIEGDLPGGFEILAMTLELRQTDVTGDAR